MSKPYTEEDLSSQLVVDRTWRIKEISDLKSAVLRADLISQKVLLRALITISYAHWEGYVRFAARKYLEHIALRKYSFSELTRQFIRNHFLPRLASLVSSKGTIAERCAIVDDILDVPTRKFSQINPDLVSTRSNLSFEVFSDICLVCGVSIHEYTDYQTFVDVFLLKRRNAIAHGEDTFIGIEDLEMITGKIVNLIRQFGDSLENQIYLKSYRAAS